MLFDYFSLGITEDGMVESLPLLLRDYTPNLDKLPNFLMRLGPQVWSNSSSCISTLFDKHYQVDWTSEEECFDTFFRELAYFYIPGPPFNSSSRTDEEQTEEKAEKWQIEHILFPAIRRYLSAPKTLLDRDVVQVASLPDLYRVFERC
jgi:DNA mismatch repair protein MLH1